MTQLSEHLSLEDFIKSDTATRDKIDNSMPDSLLETAKYTAEHLFEPVRALLGGNPIPISSGYRCEKLNIAVRGVSTSQHTKAQALDMVPKGISVPDAFEKVKNSNLVWDQLICEHDGAGHIWLHMSIVNGPNRRDIIPNLLKPNK